MLCEREDADVLLILSSLYSKGKISVVPIVSHRAVLDVHVGQGHENEKIKNGVYLD